MLYKIKRFPVFVKLLKKDYCRLVGQIKIEIVRDYTRPRIVSRVLLPPWNASRVKSKIILVQQIGGLILPSEKTRVLKHIGP
jgi:hypothetical protein